MAQGGQTPTNIQVPRIFTTAFGDPGRLAERAAKAEARRRGAAAGPIGLQGIFDVDGVCRWHFEALPLARGAHFSQKCPFC